ncbi:MAG: hypothetical protein ABFD10_13455 [Prolixibacteraceae bacterium]
MEMAIEYVISGDAVSGYFSASEPEPFDKQPETKPSTSAGIINKRSDPDEKIRLFMSLFRGRDDVYAKRWENKKGVYGLHAIHGGPRRRPGYFLVKCVS